MKELTKPHGFCIRKIDLLLDEQLAQMKNLFNIATDFIVAATKHRAHLDPRNDNVLIEVLEKGSRNSLDNDQVIWSPETLRFLLNSETPSPEVLVVSNREPYIHNRDSNGRVYLQTPASGLVAALEPVMRACKGTWIAHGSGSADFDTVDATDRIRVPPQAPSYTLRRVWVSEEEQSGFYYSSANEGLWPLCHISFVRPVFVEQDWEVYRAINQRFANAVVEEAKSANPIILVQDYHFALLPKMISQKLPGATIITFWHIPWPNAETFGICPWKEEILEGLLGSSILGFHTRLYCNNFLEAADRFMESRIDRENHSICHNDKETLIRPYPISIAWPPEPLSKQASLAACRKKVRDRLHLPRDIYLGVGVERFDYTKGIPDRLHAIDSFLRNNPEWREHVVFVQVCAPTRSKLGVYRELQKRTIELADKINDRHGTINYKPIHLIIKHYEPPEVFELFRAADFCIVSSLHDGMNLVAKEFVAARDDEQGVLILSSFAGASKELTGALLINPYDPSSTGKEILRALQMTGKEQRERMHLMRELVRAHNVYRWAGQILRDTLRLRRRQHILKVADHESCKATA
jgi:trehalose 6-phosphate synthase